MLLIFLLEGFRRVLLFLAAMMHPQHCYITQSQYLSLTPCTVCDQESRAELNSTILGFRGLGFGLNGQTVSGLCGPIVGIYQSFCLLYKIIAYVDCMHLPGARIVGSLWWISSNVKLSSRFSARSPCVSIPRTARYPSDTTVVKTTTRMSNR